MIAKTIGYVLTGLDGREVDVEVDTNLGLPSFEIVGLPDAAVKESKERVRSAIKNSGKRFPNHKITVNLAPAELKKEGAGLDLPIAVGIVAASGQLGEGVVKPTVLVGELSLDGRIRGVNGVLPMLISARENGAKRVIIPKENAEESGYIDGMEIFVAEKLSDVLDFLEGKTRLCQVELKKYVASPENCAYENDLKYVKGQLVARRALEVAVSGNHNIVLQGPPGAGKTMLAKCVPSIMPDMSFAEALETTKIHSVAGLLKGSEGIVYKRPFMTPHHTASSASVIGGGQSAKPGIVSLAHNGALFLDEMAEYPRGVLESLRQPLEDREITVSRVKGSYRYPANFTLIGSMNPCPCGYFGSKDKECSCSPSQIKKYKEKLSGPLLDRMDIRINVESVKYDDLSSEASGESSAEVRKRVCRTRAVQRERFKDDDISSNGEMSERHINKYCRLSPECEDALRYAFESLRLSARARSRIIKVARTIADMELSEEIESVHVLEAISYRGDDI